MGIQNFLADSAADSEAGDIAHGAAAGPQEAAGPQGGRRRQERMDARHMIMLQLAKTCNYCYVSINLVRWIKA